MNDFDKEIAEMDRQIERRREAREQARERIDDGALPDATTLLWIDAAEVYAVCGACYRENKAGVMSGFTENPNEDRLRRKMKERLERGVPCSLCKRDRENELVNQILDDDHAE